MIFRTLIIVLSFAIFSGCASTTLAPQTANKMQQSRIATAAYVVDKKIVYNEMVYKGLYNETRTQEAVFDGFWDIDQAYTETLTSVLAELNLNASAASQALSDDNQARFEQSVKQSLAAAQNSDQYTFALDSGVRSSLTEAGYDYLVLLRTPHLMVNTTSMIDSATIMIPSALIILDLSENREELNDFLLVQGFTDYEESVRELELNNLALIKTATNPRLRMGLENRLADILAIERKN